MQQISLIEIFWSQITAVKKFFFSPYQKQYSKTMGNALHTYSSMLFTFSIKPKQDKNVNLKKFSFGD